MKDEKAKAFEPAVKKAAQQAEYRWNRFMPKEDIEQELWLFILTSPSAQRYLSERDYDDQVAALKMKANAIVSQEKVDYEHFIGNIFYIPSDVRRIAGLIVRGQKVRSDEKADFDRALDQLQKENEGRYKDFVTLFIREEHLTQGSERNKKHRCLEKMTEIMNRIASLDNAEKKEGDPNAVR